MTLRKRKAGRPLIAGLGVGGHARSMVDALRAERVGLLDPDPGLAGRAIGGVRVLGGHVHTATGARPTGGVWMEDGARVGAGAVVVEDDPREACVAGVPARPLPERS